MGESGVVNLKEELEHLIILIASRCLLGIEVRDSISDEIIALVNEINVACVPLTIIFPYLPIPPHRRRDKARKRLDDIFSKIIASRKSTQKSVKNDMLQCLIDSKYKDGRPLSVKEITCLLVTTLYGGQRLSAATSIWTGAYLLHHKKYWYSAMEEQKELIKKHGNAVTYDVLSEMQVLYRCIKEALRLQPPIPLFLRQSHTDFTVTTREGKRYDIPKGHIIASSPVFSNRLPHIYKNPNAYEPERFSPVRDEEKLGGQFSYTSFGGGRHSCVGEHFSYLEMKIIWSYLLRNFDLELISPFPQTEFDIVWGVKGKVIVKYQRKKFLVD